MADLNQRMSSLGMNESIHATDGVPSSGASNQSSGSGGQRVPSKDTYIPPHMRNAVRSGAGPGPGPAPATGVAPPVQNGAPNGVHASRWSNGYVSLIFDALVPTPMHFSHDPKLKFLGGLLSSNLWFPAMKYWMDC